jgi:hypothetical protein
LEDFIFYFPLNSGRATLVVGKLGISAVGTGTEATVTPKDFEKLPGAHRGHLWRRILGGSGGTRRNLVPMYPMFNLSRYKLALEHPAARLLQKDGAICFAVAPKYDDDGSGVPKEI